MNLLKNIFFFFELIQIDPKSSLSNRIENLYNQ